MTQLKLSKPVRGRLSNFSNEPTIDANVTARTAGVNRKRRGSGRAELRGRTTNSESKPRRLIGPSLKLDLGKMRYRVVKSNIVVRSPTAGLLAGT